MSDNRDNEEDFNYEAHLEHVLSMSRKARTLRCSTG